MVAVSPPPVERNGSHEMMKKTSIILTLVIFAAGCATHPAQIRYAHISAGPGMTHTLVKGETIWRLAETYGVKAESILKANGIKNPSQLKVGTPIFIPGVGGEPLRTLPFLPNSRKWQYVIIHHSATEIGNAELFDRGHRRRGFWNGLGYHFIVDNGTSGTQGGEIETSHRWIHQMDGAHCNAMDMNAKGIGICLVGNFDDKHVSKEQFDSLVWLVRQLQAKYKIKKSHILEHHQVPGKGGTHCPGKNFPWAEFMSQLR